MSNKVGQVLAEGGFIKYILAVVIAVLSSLIIVDHGTVEREREGCERRMMIFNAIVKGFKEAADTIPADAPSGLRQVLYREAAKIDRYVIKNCDEFYQPIVKFVR